MRTASSRKVSYCDFQSKEEEDRHDIPTLTAVLSSSSEARLPVPALTPPDMLSRLLLLFAGLAMALRGL